MSGSEKILLITTEFPPGPGGIGNHAYNLAKYLNIKGIQTDVLTVSDFADDEQARSFDKAQNFRIERFDRFSSRFRTYSNRISVASRRLRESNYSHVIYSGRSSLMMSVLLKKHLKNAKSIMIIHGGDVSIKGNFEKRVVSKALRECDLAVAVSNFSKSKIPDIGVRERTVVIPNGFDVPENFRSRTGRAIDNGRLGLVTVGTIWPRKGQHNVLRALAGVKSKFPEVTYSIVGRSADLSLLKEFMDKDEIKTHVNIISDADDKRKFGILSQSDIFILLSEDDPGGDFEGFGIAVIEANHFGLPAVGSKGSGLEDSISNGYSGILVDPKNAVEVCEAVVKIAEDYKVFSSNAVKWADRHHWSEIVKRYISEIEKLN